MERSRSRSGRGVDIRVASPVTVSQRVVQPHDSTAPAVPTATPDGTRPLLWKASWAWWLAALAPTAKAAATAKKLPFILKRIRKYEWLKGNIRRGYCRYTVRRKKRMPAERVKRWLFEG